MDGSEATELANEFRERAERLSKKIDMLALGIRMENGELTAEPHVSDDWAFFHVEEPGAQGRTVSYDRTGRDTAWATNRDASPRIEKKPVHMHHSTVTNGLKISLCRHYRHP